MQVDSVVSFLDEIETHKSAMMFRGHSNSDWKLLPSIARLDPSLSPIKHDNGWQGIENNLLGEFKRYASMHLKQEPKSKLEWMIQAQHHGLPTRLLDWSTNPLKALYFAVENTKYDDVDGKVFVFTPRMWSTSEQSISNIEKTNCIDVFYPVVINDRVLAQEGCFILFPQREDHDEFKPLEEGFSTQDAVGMSSIIVKKEIKPIIRKQLEKLGVNDMTMFPDLDGISKNIRRMFGAL